AALSRTLVRIPVPDPEAWFPWCFSLPLVRVDLFHCAGGTRQISPGLVEAMQSVDSVVVRAGQLVLRRDDFDVVGDARSKAVLSLPDCFLGQAHAKFGSLDFTAGRFQLSTR